VKIRLDVRARGATLLIFTKLFKKGSEKHPQILLYIEGNIFSLRKGGFTGCQPTPDTHIPTFDARRVFGYHRRERRPSPTKTANHTATTNFNIF
jgi:hypothetical protein